MVAQTFPVWTAQTSACDGFGSLGVIGNEAEMAGPCSRGAMSVQAWEQLGALRRVGNQVWIDGRSRSLARWVGSVTSNSSSCCSDNSESDRVHSFNQVRRMNLGHVEFHTRYRVPVTARLKPLLTATSG